MKRNVFSTVMLGMVLAFGLMVAGCEDANESCPGSPSGAKCSAYLYWNGSSLVTIRNGCGRSDCVVTTGTATVQGISCDCD